MWLPPMPDGSSSGPASKPSVEHGDDDLRDSDAGGRIQGSAEINASGVSHLGGALERQGPADSVRTRGGTVMRHIARAMFLVVALEAVGLPAAAQTLGTLAGAAKDSSG